MDVRIKRVCLLAFASAMIIGCSSTGAHRLLPDSQAWQSAAMNAARHPATWAPLVGAGIIAAGGWDHEISDWARENTPIFGSENRAQHRSDLFRTLSHAGMQLTSFLVFDVERGYWIPLAERTVVQYSGVIIATSVRYPIKKIIGRDRPKREEYIEEGRFDAGLESFPSGHATRAFAYVGMSYRNIEALKLPGFWEYSAKTLTTCLGYTVAWARVEAGAHYPTDVLVGAALGNFIALLFNDAFLGRENGLTVQFTPDYIPVVCYSWSF